VNRWDAEFDRLLALGAAGLRSLGEAEPAKHLYACGAQRSTALLIKRTPLNAAEITHLRRHCTRSKFTEAFAPDNPHGELRRRISGAEPLPAQPTDLRAPTDDRPFFFYGVPGRMLPAVLRDVKALQTDHQGLLTLVALLAVSTVIAALCLLGPLALRRAPASSAPSPRLRPLLFFASLGAGFVFVELSLVQHLALFLGHPVYALSAVLTALLLWAGLGSLLTAKIEAPLAALSAGRRAQALVVLLALFAVLLGPALSRFVGLPFAARLGLTVLLLAPLGLLMGAEAPLGLKLVASRSPELVPWCWGVSGVAGVIATALGTLTAMHLGYSALLLLSGAAYLVAAAAVPRAPAEETAREAIPAGIEAIGSVVPAG
jgi:hypothetical protein